MKIRRKKKKKKNHGSQYCAQRDHSPGNFLRQCRKTLLITASYQLFAISVTPSTVPFPPVKPEYDQTLLNTVSDQVSQFFASPAFAWVPPVGPSGPVGCAVVRTPTAPMAGAPAAVGGMMIINSIMQVAIQGMMHRATNAPLQAQQKAQAAQIQQWLTAEQERIANLVAQQRSLRDAEVKEGQDELAKALSDKWDAGKGPSGVGSALSDPGVVDLRPQGTPFFGTGGDSSVVDLRDRTRDIPEIPNDRKPPRQEKVSNPIPSSESGRKLQQMIRDNQDPARLDANLKKLEDQLAGIKELSEKINTGMNFSHRDLQTLYQSLTPTIQEGLLRGMSLIMGLGSEDLIKFYQEMKANPGRMNKLVDAMNTVNDFTNFAIRYDKFKPGELKDAMWNEANRDLMRNLDFFRTQNVVNSGQFQTGKNMIKESMELAQSREELSKIEVRVKIQGLSPFFWDRKKQLDQQVQKLAETTRGARRDLALKKDFPPIPEKPAQVSLKSASVPSQKSSVPTIDNLKVIPLDLKQNDKQPPLTTQAPHGEPPLPAKRYKTVVFQGMTASQREDQTFMKAIQNDPLLQNPDESYGFVFPGGPQSDRLMLNPESNPDLFLNKIPEIKHIVVDRLVFTSNMAPFVKMMIERRFIKVNTLFFISESLLKDYPGQEALMRLAKERNILFHWYLIRDGKLIVK